MDRDSLIFCAGSLVVSLLIAFIAFPFVAVDPETVAAAEKIVPAYEMGEVEVGEGFGLVAVEELMMYYVENPPAVESTASAPEVRFGGC